MVYNIWDKVWRLTILSNDWYHIFPSWQKTKKVNVKCDCWSHKSIILWSIWERKWKVSSCWCLAKDKSTKHGMSNSRIYKIYVWINIRCNNKNRDEHRLYWWRWIKNERKSFEEFYKDMWESYNEHVKLFWEKNTSIDRIDTNSNYNKDNCRWATKKIQSNNTTSNNYITYKWRTQTMKQRADELKINYRTISTRIHRDNMSIEEAFTREVWAHKKTKK